jgi:tetratricopeptide (TPR) repeat protein
LQGRLGEAETCFLKVLDASPDNAIALNNLGNLCLQQGRTDDAIHCYQRLISVNPSSAEAYNNIGVAYRAAGALEDAITYCKMAVSLNPEYADAYCNLGSLLVDRLDLDGAERCYRSALRYQPDNADAHRNIGKLFQTSGRYEEASQSYKKALEYRPDDPDTIAAIASLEEKLGRRENAQALIQGLINSGSTPLAGVILLATLAREEDDVRKSIDLLNEFLASESSTNSKADIHFALGTLYDRKSEYGKAFEHFQSGNMQDSFGYDKDEYERQFQLYIRTFSGERIKTLPRSSNYSELPVFIVGMPRSGTTLVEQILSSHPELAGGGELGSISEISSSLHSGTSPGTPYPTCISSLDSATINEIADAYVAKMAERAGHALRITDKSPLHFMELGLINMLLPGARIIHCTRNPLDTCLSIYFHRFNKLHAYSGDLSNLGHFYRQYEKLMRHWKSVIQLPVLEVSYEDMVENTEELSRKMVSFCGLQWNDQCLRFYESGRVADTPSYNQVRRKIYTSSVGRWKHYSMYIRELVDALEKYK